MARKAVDEPDGPPQLGAARQPKGVGHPAAMHAQPCQGDSASLERARVIMYATDDDGIAGPLRGGDQTAHLKERRERAPLVRQGHSYWP